MTPRMTFIVCFTFLLLITFHRAENTDDENSQTEPRPSKKASKKDDLDAQDLNEQQKKVDEAKKKACQNSTSDNCKWGTLKLKPYWKQLLKCSKKNYLLLFFLTYVGYKDVWPLIFSTSKVSSTQTQISEPPGILTDPTLKIILIVIGVISALITFGWIVWYFFLQHTEELDDEDEEEGGEKSVYKNKMNYKEVKRNKAYGGGVSALGPRGRTASSNVYPSALSEAKRRAKTSRVGTTRGTSPSSKANTINTTSSSTWQPTRAAVTGQRRSPMQSHHR